jgi:Tol biopolymer transport system component
VGLRLSPDGKRVALIRTGLRAGQHLWLADLSSRVFSRFTSDAKKEHDPVWSL